MGHSSPRTGKLSAGNALRSWRNGKGRFVRARRRTAGAKPYTMKVVRTVFNGGHEETYGNATRPVPTQLMHCVMRIARAQPVAAGRVRVELPAGVHGEVGGLLQSRFMPREGPQSSQEVSSMCKTRNEGK